jgi:hypothetical protein
LEHVPGVYPDPGGGSVATDDAYSRSLSSPGRRNEDNHSLKRSIEVVQFRGRGKPAPREWLTYEEARRLVGLSPTPMWKLVTSGSVKGARVGHSVLFPRKPLPGIAMPEQQRARVLNGIARLLETERDPERLAMLEPFAVQMGFRFVEAETDAVFRLDAAGGDYPRDDAAASFIHQTLGKRKEAHIR